MIFHSEDARTWSVFGPIAYTSNAVKGRFVQSLLEKIDVPASSSGNVTVWFRKREERREGLTIFFREIPWVWLCSIEEHPCCEELPRYLAWKRNNSVKYTEKLWGWKEGPVDPEGEHIQILYREDPEHFRDRELSVLDIDSILR